MVLNVVTRVNPRNFNSRLAASRITKLLGVDDFGKASSSLVKVIEDKAEGVFKDVRKAFRNLLTRSSVRLGPYQREANDANGARDTDTLYNSLNYRIRVKRSRNGYMSTSVEIFSTATHYTLVDEGYTQDRSPAIAPLLNWAIRNLPGWSVVPMVSQGTPAETIFLDLRRYEINGLKADYLFYRLYQEMSERQFEGLQLTENIVRFTNLSLQRRAREGFFTQEDLARAFS